MIRYPDHFERKPMLGKIVPERMDSAQTVLRAADVLRTVGILQEARFADLLRKTGLANATLRRLLVSLIEARLVVHDTDRKLYSLGSEAYVLGQLAQPAFSFHDLARDGLKRLADISGDTAFLSARDGLSTVCLHREEGQYPIRTHVLNVGDRHPLGMGAAALAILGALPVDSADGILEANRDVLLELRPELDLSEIADLVARARASGFALNPGLIFRGSWAIAAALRAPGGEIIGAITIAAIEDRMTVERQAELAEPLRKEVARIERLLARFGPGGVRLDAAE